MELQVRFSKLADISDIVRLVREGFPAEVGDKLIYFSYGIDKYIVNQMVESNSDTKYMTAELDGEMVGFVEYKWFNGGVVLNYIVLDRKFKGKGLATNFLHKSLSLLEPVPVKIELDVFDYNLTALHWYEKQGFKKVGESYWYEISDCTLFDTEEMVYVTNAAQSLSMFENYGFSTLNLFSSNHACCVGILGEYWLRITQREILSDIAILQFLRKKYPTRKILAILPQSLGVDEYKYFKIKEILRSYRMKLILNK